jgi:hypothetical protein
MSRPPGKEKATASRRKRAAAKPNNAICLEDANQRDSSYRDLMLILAEWVAKIEENAFLRAIESGKTEDSALYLQAAQQRLVSGAP